MLRVEGLFGSIVFLHMNHHCYLKLIIFVKSLLRKRSVTILARFYLLCDEERRITH